MGVGVFVAGPTVGVGVCVEVGVEVGTCCVGVFVGAPVSVGVGVFVGLMIRGVGRTRDEIYPQSTFPDITQAYELS